MFFRILQKDLKKKKGMNFLLLVFMCFASMFVASGLNNVITVMNGTDYYLDKAGVGDYTVITVGTRDSNTVREILNKETAISDWRMEEVIFGSADAVKTADGKDVETKNTALFQALEEGQIHFFNMENEEIKTVEAGHVYTSGEFLKKNALEVGDEIVITLGNTELNLTIDGKVKDALLGSDFMGNTRFLLSKADMNKLRADETIVDEYHGQVIYMNGEDITQVASCVNKLPNVNFDGAKSVIKMCYVMDLVVAFIVLIMSACLIIVALVVLKFIISLTISDEFREIGVLKAIGMKNIKIRSIYLTKYFFLSVVAAIIGFFASIPFCNLLLKSVSENMVLGNEMGITANAIGAVLIVVVILLFAFYCTKSVKRVTPVDAIRSGQTGERYHKATACRIGKSIGGNSLFLAVNDIFSRPKQYLTIALSILLCTSFVLILVNTASTMRSDKLIYSFGTKSDLYVSDVGRAMQNMYSGGREGNEQFMTDMEKKLKEKGMPANIVQEAQFKYNISFEGREYKVTCQQGIETKTQDYWYTEGVAPMAVDEIAITPQISEKTGAKIGDVLTIDFGSEKKECIVTAYFQTMNQLGETIRLHEDAPTDFMYISTLMSYQINFTDKPTPEEIETRKEECKELFDADKVMNAAEYCVDCTAVADTMDAVKVLLLVIVLIVIMLVTILMEQSFITDEKSQIALLKAIGFNDGFVIRWHVLRFGIVACAAVLLAGMLSIPLTELSISPVFGMMGQSEVDFNIEPLQVFVIYPLIVLAATVAAAFLTAQSSRKIKSRDCANIE